MTVEVEGIKCQSRSLKMCLDAEERKEKNKNKERDYDGFKQFELEPESGCEWERTLNMPKPFTAQGK